MPKFSVFCAASQLSSGLLPYPLSLGLTISALVCLDFASRLSVHSWWWSCHWHSIHLSGSTNTRVSRTVPMFRFSMYIIMTKSQLTTKPNKDGLRTKALLLRWYWAVTPFSVLLVYNFISLLFALPTHPSQMRRRRLWRGKGAFSLVTLLGRRACVLLRKWRNCCRTPFPPTSCRSKRSQCILLD